MQLRHLSYICHVVNPFNLSTKLRLVLPPAKPCRSVASRADQCWRFAERAQNTRFRTPHRFTANVDDGPIQRTAVLLRREGQNSHARVAPDQEAALALFFMTVL